MSDEDAGPRSGTAAGIVERTGSAAETEAVGARIGSLLVPGDVALVSGELGSGKTTLIRGACRALGVEAPIQSPTFTIGRRYRGRVPISHLDLFRLPSLADEDPGLLADYLEPTAIVFIEWPAVAEPRVVEGEWPGMRIRARVAIRHAGGDRREIEVRQGPA